MYGVVLMMAMAGGAETPALFNRGCKGCSGCSGTVTYSCSGSSCYGGCKGHRTHKVKRSKGCCGYVTCCGAPVVACCGYPVISHPAPVISRPVTPVVPPVKGKKIEKLKKPPVDNETVEAAPARITITVPSDARVSIDGTMTTSTETTRTFESPILLNGKSYSYTFKAEFVRDGKEVVVTREVSVKAGTDVTVSLENPSVVASR